MQSMERSTRSSKRYVTNPAPNHELQSAPTDTGQYMCIECSETFDNKLELNSHRQSHVTKKQFTCSHCGRGFHHQVFLQMHERSHEDGLSHTSLTRTTAGRAISTRSSKPSPDTDIIHVAPAPTKSSCRLNSVVKFKREQKAHQDVAPRECVTRRTQGTCSPAHQRTDDSDKTQFELRIAKLSDSTIHLIDPYGNTLEILAEVFNTYTIGEPEEEEEGVSPTTDSRISETSSPPTSSTVHLDDEITQDMGVCPSPPAEVSEPTEEDLPLCRIQSVSSASISPKTVPDLIDDAEDVLSSQTPRDSAGGTFNPQVEDQVATEIPINSTEKRICPKDVQDSSMTCEDQTVAEGLLAGDVGDDELPVVAAQTEDPSLRLGDDPISEELRGGRPHTGDSPNLSKPMSPEPLINIDNQEKDGSTSSLETRNEKDPSLNESPSITEMDLSLDVNEECVKDSQDLEIDRVMSLSDTGFDNNMVSVKSGLGGMDIDAVEQLGLDKSSAVTLLEDERTLPTQLLLNECLSEYDEHLKESVSLTRGPGSSGHDFDLQTEPSMADIVYPTPVDNAVVDPKAGSDGDLTKSEVDVCSPSQEVIEEASLPLDVCSSEPITQNVPSPLMSLDIIDHKAVVSSDHEGDHPKREVGEDVHISSEQQASQPDELSQVDSGSVPVVQAVLSPPEQYPAPPGGDGHEAYNKADVVIPTPQKNDGSSEPNPDDDPGPPLHDIQPPRSSDLEQGVNLRDEEMEADVTASSENEEKQVPQGEAPALTPVELLSLTNIESPMDESSSHENIEKITSDKKISVVEPSEDNPISPLELEAVASGKDLLPPCDEDLSLRNYTESQDVSFTVPTLVSITSACVKAQETKATEQDAAARTTSDEERRSNRSIEISDLREDALLENLESEGAGTTLCLLEPTLELTPELEVLSEKRSLSSDDVKDLAEIEKNLSHEDPHKQYIQMSNASLTENDLADDFEDSESILLDAPGQDGDVSAVSVDDESAPHELSDLLSPEVQDGEYTEGPDDKSAGFGGQCLKCGRRVRRGRKEMVWFPACYKCRLKAKRDERHSGEGSSDLSSFHIKQEADSAQDNTFYKTVQPEQSLHVVGQEPAAPLPKMYKCPKCEKSFRIPALLASHMKCHTLPQCLSCGCPMTLKYKTKRVPKRCSKCFQKIKQQRKEERALGGGGGEDEDDSLDSDTGSLFVDEADLSDDNEPEDDPSSTKLVEDPKPGSVKGGTEPFHSIFMRKRKKMNPAIQALYCTCEVVPKSGAKQPKICKTCQKPVRDRLVTLPKSGLIEGRQVLGGKVTPLKKTSKPSSEADQQGLEESSTSHENELGPDEDVCKEEENESFTDLDTSDQIVSPDGEKPRLCPQCGKIFKCKRSMNLHLLSHSATQCESCGCRLQKKKRAGRWSKKCRVCRLLTKDKGPPEESIEEDLPSDKGVASLRLKMKQSKIVKSRKIQSIAKHKKDLKWMNMILGVKGLTRRPRKKKEPSQEKSGYSLQAAVYSGTGDHVLASSPGTSGLHVSQKKILGRIPKVNRKCIYREKNIIKVEEQQMPPYINDPSSAQISVKEEEENQCLECNEIFPSFDLLLSHQQGHVKDPPFTCTQCPQSFSTEQYLSIHVSSHAEGPPFRCPECNKTFTRRNHLGVHRRVHTGARPFACPDCPCRFRQRGSLIIHRYTHRNLQLLVLKPYQCSICSKSFKQKERLVIHERLHTGECPFSCKDCDKVFPSKSRLYMHRKIHKSPGAPTSENPSGKEESERQPYQCKDCDKICSTKASLVLHCKVHKSSAIGDQSGSHEENLEETTNETPMSSEQFLNIKTEPEGHPFSCQDCNKVCSTKASLVLHRKVHRLDPRSDAGRFVCKDCGKVCLTKASLVLHRKVHKSPLMCGLKANIGNSPYVCPDCNKVCSTKASFVLHCKVHKASSSGEQILKTNVEQKAFICKECDFVCSTKSSFVLHRKMHRSSAGLVGSGDHPFTCKDCDKVCSTKASFVLHCKVHRALPGGDQSLIPQPDVEEKPYHCKDCGKIYSTKGRLLSHLKLHAGQDGSAEAEQLKMDTEEKPFACPVCHMRFKRLKILVRHKLIHGEDVFRCGHCGKRFLFQKSLMNHAQVCLKRSKGKSLLGKEKVPKKRKSKDGSSIEESAPKKRKNESKKAVTAVQKLKNKKLLKAKKLAINKEKSKAKSGYEKKPKKLKVEAEPDPEAEGEKQSDGKQERPPETVSKEKEGAKDKKAVGKVKKGLKKVPLKQKRQKVSSESLKKWRMIAAATVKKRKLQAVMSGGKKKVTVKKKGPSKAKTGGKNSKE